MKAIRNIRPLLERCKVASSEGDNGKA
jgi:hypothetical protein